MNNHALEALWKNVIDRWDDEKAHGAFLEHCRSSDQLAEAAARYRGMAGDRERGENASKRLQGVAMLAMAKLESSRSSRAQARGSRLVSLLLIAFFITATAVLLLYL